MALLPPTIETSRARLPALDQLFGITGKSQALFFRQLSSMVQAGLTFNAALATVQKNTGGGALRHWLDDALPRLRDGLPLAKAFADYPALWSPFIANMIEAAEKSGRVDVTLVTLADYLERQYTAKLDLLVRLAYPFLICNAGMLIPAVPTLYLHGFGPYFKQVWPPLVGFYACFVALFLVQRSTLLRPVKATFDSVVLFIPVFGNFVRMQSIMWFIRSLAELYEAGIPVAKAVQLSADACGNTRLAHRLSLAVHDINEGRSLTQAFASLNVLPPSVMQIMSSSEQSGATGTSLRKAADMIEVEVRALSATIGVVLPVVVFLIVAGFAAVQIIGQFQAIYAPLNDIMK